MTAKQTVCSMLLALALCSRSPAQLAITELMSGSAAATGFSGPDFFELTNFSEQDIDVHGYTFSDSRIVPVAWAQNAFTNLVIRARETIIFCRTNVYVATYQAFTNWWGATNLPGGLRVRFYPAQNTGFDGDPGPGDKLVVYDAAGRVIDFVSYPSATRGRTFISDPNTGTFGKLSVFGEERAFKAALTDDIGSPGYAPEHLPLRIVVQPESLVLDGCGSATLRVVAYGLPRPEYRWRRDGITIPGQNRDSVDLTPPDVEGMYDVIVSNGLSELVSEPAAVAIVNTNSFAPKILESPENVTVFHDGIEQRQTAVFSIEALSFPCAEVQWQLNGTELPGGNAFRAEIPINPDLPYTHTNRVTATIWNEKGSTNVSAALIVTPWPHLQITEVMAYPTNDLFAAHEDWFEMVNGGPTAIDLYGYRLADSLSFHHAFTITNHVLIQPGEGIIFVEAMSAAEFRQWWGFGQFPPGQKIITFGGFALDNNGDTIFLWNAAARDPANEAVTTVGFPASKPGVSFELEPYCAGFGCTDDPSLLRFSSPGTNGAFYSADRQDLGSPGIYKRPQIISARPTGTAIEICCRAIQGKNYRLLSSPSILSDVWTPLVAAQATDYIVRFLAPLSSSGNRFYRVEEVP